MIEKNSITDNLSTKKGGLFSSLKSKRPFTCSWLNEELDSAGVAVANKVAQLHCIIQNCLRNSMIVEFSQSSKLQNNVVNN
jgi:hypothetical protein